VTPSWCCWRSPPDESWLLLCWCSPTYAYTKEDKTNNDLRITTRDTTSFVSYIDSIAIEACMLPYNHPPDDAGGSRIEQCMRWACCVTGNGHVLRHLEGFIKEERVRLSFEWMSFWTRSQI
jgi:hypothetical protein